MNTSYIITAIITAILFAIITVQYLKIRSLKEAALRFKDEKKQALKKLEKKFDDVILSKNTDLAQKNKIENCYKEAMNNIYYYAEGTPVFRALQDYRSIIVDAYSNDFKQGTTMTLYFQIALDEYLKILSSSMEKLTKELAKIDSNKINPTKLNKDWEDKKSADNMLDKIVKTWENVGMSDNEARESFLRSRTPDENIFFEAN